MIDCAARWVVIIGLLVSTTAWAQDEALVRVMRYLPLDSRFAGQACHGQVVRAEYGIPHEVVNLGVFEPTLCQSMDVVDVDPLVTRLALRTAESLLRTDLPRWLPEQLAASELADRVLPPVAFTQAAMDARRRIVIGVGLNYLDHKAEVGMGDAIDPNDLLLFAKSTPPTSAYAPVPTGLSIGSMPPRPVVLMDYEAEIGLALLEDIDLRAPPSAEVLAMNSALVVVTDVSDRRPIIRDDVHGYTRGKSHPGYLPLGPWLVPGWQLNLATRQNPRDALDIELRVTTGGTNERGIPRQSARSSNMLHMPAAILSEISRRFQADTSLCMPDAWGQPRYLHDDQGRIPAGSILMTGTPGGTALKIPDLLDKIRLFFEGGLNVSGARDELIEELEAEAGTHGFLAPGDTVETWIHWLGRQRWVVIEPTTEEASGIDGTGGCDDFGHN